MLCLPSQSTFHTSHNNLGQPRMFVVKQCNENGCYKQVLFDYVDSLQNVQNFFFPLINFHYYPQIKVNLAQNDWLFQMLNKLVTLPVQGSITWDILPQICSSGLLNVVISFYFFKLIFALIINFEFQVSSSRQGIHLFNQFTKQIVVQQNRIKLIDNKRMQANRFKSDDHRFDQYIENLKQHGLKVHPSLKPAIFTLNNGLQYPGLRVTEDIKGEQILVTVPVSLLLTSHKARQQNELQVIFSHPFYSKCQDRILITYLLYLYSKKDETNIWYQMVRLFSKEIDILSFWQTQQLLKFSDKSIQRGANLERENFRKEWMEFEDVMMEYEQFFNNREEAFSKQNYQWIYVHAVSRCFGSFMNSTYFTPFCQFFNHHCVDVTYQCVTIQQYNKQSQKQSQNSSYQQNQHSQDQLSQTSSISSANSIDYIDDGDFNYWQVESYKIKWGGKISFDLKDKQTKEINKLYDQCQLKLDKTLLWNGYSLTFIGQIIEKLNILKNQYMAGRKKFPMAKEEFIKIKALIDNYKSQAITFYKLMGGKYDPKTQTQQNIDNLSPVSQQSNHLSASVYVKTTSPPTKDYKYFLMESGSTAQFYKDEQIYFCYGRLSNRTMLIRYGCCIQDNRYEHVWVKLSLNKVLSPYPDLFERLQQKGLPITYKLKLRPHTWPSELYLWFKVSRWQLTRHSIHQIFYPYDIDNEISIFQKIFQTISQKVKQYSVYPNYDELEDKKIAYHEYFTRVYHKEKVRILDKQKEMVGYVLGMLGEMKKDKRLPSVKEIRSFRFNKQLKGYWKILLHGQVTF